MSRVSLNLVIDRMIRMFISHSLFFSPPLPLSLFVPCSVEGRQSSVQLCVQLCVQLSVQYSPVFTSPVPGWPSGAQSGPEYTTHNSQLTHSIYVSVRVIKASRLCDCAD